MLANIRFVLVETTHPGNIGAVARAMKNMCLEQLALVNPGRYPGAEATARASGADDLLARARICSDLGEAVGGCRTLVGTSARPRTIAWPQLDPRQCAELLTAESEQGPVALIFGRESSGLTNAELDRCQYLAQIPTNPEFSSLNLAAAAQLFAWELYRAHQRTVTAAQDAVKREVAAAEAMEGFHRHLAQTLEDIGFSDPAQSKKLLRRLRRLFNRARPDWNELNILRGILSAAQGRKTRGPQQRRPNVRED